MSEYQSTIKVVVDENIALPDSLSERLQLTVMPGRQILAHHVVDADALLVRSVTRVDSQLLQNSTVRFVGTATSGTDHLDLPWLTGAGVTVADAAGANAGAVTDYVLSCLASLLQDRLINWQEMRVAVVGVGRVGSQLVRRLQALGVDCIGCDPFQRLVEDLPYVPLSEALQADVVCLHTPLTHEGDHPTRHMLDARRLAGIAPGTILINAGRGEVIDNQALRAHAQMFPERKFILDVWEHEPRPDTELLRLAYIATPHIAGYSRESKEQAGERIVQALYQHFNIADIADVTDDGARNVGASIKQGGATDNGANDATTSGGILLSHAAQKVVAERISQCFSASELSERFSRDYLAATTDAQAADTFDRYRREQLGRREFAALPLPAGNLQGDIRRALTAAGFTVQR